MSAIAYPLLLLLLLLFFFFFYGCWCLFSLGLHHHSVLFSAVGVLFFVPKGLQFVSVCSSFSMPYFDLPQPTSPGTLSLFLSFQFHISLIVDFWGFCRVLRILCLILADFCFWVFPFFSFTFTFICKLLQRVSGILLLRLLSFYF